MARQSGGISTGKISPETAALPVKFINQREFEEVACKAKAATLKRQSPEAFANLRLRSTQADNCPYGLVLLVMSLYQPNARGPLLCS
jgi:hypothetical protein